VQEMRFKNARQALASLDVQTHHVHVSLPLLGLFRGGGRGGLYVRVQGGREGGVGAWVGRLTMAKKRQRLRPPWVSAAANDASRDCCACVMVAGGGDVMWT